ncbi:short-chain dehydrogenase/reductas [Clostridia bacterium]|nr:short-chain dehydrogenase/reductas [Clostridia bacterium]
MKDDVFVVVGGSKAGGIGMGVTEVLSGYGKLVITGVTQAEVDEGNEYLKTKSIEAVSLVCDVLVREDVDKLIETAQGAGKIKGVAVITGLTPACPDWKLIMSVNLLSIIELVKAFGEVMESGSSFVLFGSNSPYQLKRDMLDQTNDLLYGADSDPDFIEKISPFVLSSGAEMASNFAYPISKRGVQLMARKYAVILGEKGIRVNSVSPGTADTLRNQELLPIVKSLYRMVNELTPSKRMGSVIEMGNVVAFLLSDQASFVSGIDILIDGALAANMRLQKLVEQF